VWWLIDIHYCPILVVVDISMSLAKVVTLLFSQPKINNWTRYIDRWHNERVKETGLEWRSSDTQRIELSFFYKVCPDPFFSFILSRNDSGLFNIVLKNWKQLSINQEIVPWSKYNGENIIVTNAHCVSNIFQYWIESIILYLNVLHFK